MSDPSVVTVRWSERRLVRLDAPEPDYPIARARVETTVDIEGWPGLDRSFTDYEVSVAEYRRLIDFVGRPVTVRRVDGVVRIEAAATA